ncbi:PIR protein CIR protein [Plasmodium vinckei vinckei]|uniref:PIR protein CIR protein n=1 Tax=Plasmodium vinckei vinckei TaxID=54757 RepID=A0A449BZ40_PLAVN|nr:PIR protein CIR protein [Plasmodium vinckei vinckei]VEV58760.1 PIR protein CIR protein [Plasmodium vinckei vinckei]
MDSKKMCEFLINADKYFDGNKVDINKINKNKSIKTYCHNDDCKTKENGINALAAYIIMLFKGLIKKDEYNDYDEYLLMWLSDKLLKIRNESKEKKVKPPYMDTITLNQAYEKHLKDHKVKLRYWDLLDMIKGLKEANLRYMAEFYLLLNRICKTIAYYETKGAESKKLSKHSDNCLDQYRNLYINISECKSYLNLLNKLKGIYDDFRVSAIQENGSNNNLETDLKKLTKPNGEEMAVVRGFISYKITKKICNSLNKKTTTSNKADSPGLSHSSKEVPPLQPLNQLKDSHDKTSPEEPSAKLESPSPSLQDSYKSEKIYQSESNDSDIGLGNSKSETCSDVEKGKINGGGKEPETPSGEKCSQVSIGDGGNGGGENIDSDQSNTGGVQGDNGGSVSEQGGSDNAPVEEVTQSTLGDPFNTVPLLFSISSKGIDQLNNGLKFYKEKKEQLTNAKDTIKNLYNTSVSNVNNFFEKFSDFFNDIIDNISTDSNQVDSPAESGGGGDDPSQPQKDSEHTQKTPQNSPSSTEQNETDQSSEESSGNQDSDQNDQGSEKPVEVPVIIPTDPESGIKGNGTIGIGDIYIFKEFKKIGIPIIVIIISITLAIMYKFLVFERRKKLKRKKMKKSTNLFGVNKTT